MRESLTAIDKHLATLCYFLLSNKIIFVVSVCYSYSPSAGLPGIALLGKDMIDEPKIYGKSVRLYNILTIAFVMLLRT